jgi:flavodoxin
MKAIIVYYSQSANNEILARELKMRLGCDLLKIEETQRTGFTILLDRLFQRDTKIRKPDVFLNDYNLVVFIAPIWNAKIATPLKTFIKMEKDHIKKYAFITLCSGREGQHEKITDQLAQLALKKPIVVTELEVNDLLPAEKKNKIKYTTPYRITKYDFHVFKKQIQHFVNTIFEYGSELRAREPFIRQKTLV